MIVPVSMTSLQKQLYKTILSKLLIIIFPGIAVTCNIGENVDIMKNFLELSGTKHSATNVNNLLMQLRKWASFIAAVFQREI